jgi:hypothetical protein
MIDPESVMTLTGFRFDLQTASSVPEWQCAAAILANPIYDPGLRNAGYRQSGWIDHALAEKPLEFTPPPKLAGRRFRRRPADDCGSSMSHSFAELQTNICLGL